LFRSFGWIAQIEFLPAKIVKCIGLMLAYGSLVVP
jgi:hypothetical protein